MPASMPSTGHELPDLFRYGDGSRVLMRADWPKRRAEIAAAIVPAEYGELPPARALFPMEKFRPSVTSFEGKRYLRPWLAVDGAEGLLFFPEVYLPSGPGPFPVIVSGDGCWPMNDKIPREVVTRGVILALFNREAFMFDGTTPKEEPFDLRHAFPGDYGALTAWAWGYHRTIDYLLTLPEVDPARIAVMGHSRGGKAALLAGATDERIAVTCANQSGCGGAGCFRWQGEKSETLRDILAQFPHWFAPDLHRYLGRETELPFDQHSLKALIAPRALLTTEALGDPWANPEGSWQTHRAAREVYRFLGVEDKIGIRFRAGPHDQTLLDWQALLDFMEVQFQGKASREPFDQGPFDLPPAHAWCAPLS
jgi:dienelactone hydrolase